MHVEYVIIMVLIIVFQLTFSTHTLILEKFQFAKMHCRRICLLSTRYVKLTSIDRITFYNEITRFIQLCTIAARVILVHLMHEVDNISLTL